jgi:hypothetical protein
MAGRKQLPKARLAMGSQNGASSRAAASRRSCSQRLRPILGEWPLSGRQFERAASGNSGLSPREVSYRWNAQAHGAERGNNDLA